MGGSLSSRLLPRVSNPSVSSEFPCLQCGHSRNNGFLSGTGRIPGFNISSIKSNHSGFIKKTIMTTTPSR